MGESKKRSSRIIWITGLTAALAIHAVGLLLFQVGKEEVSPLEPDGFAVSLPSILWQEAQGDLLREQAHLFDSAPLFLPTRWNSASSPEVRGLEQSPADLFNPFPARLSYGEADFGLGMVRGVEGKPLVESLKVFVDRTHTLFGRGPVDQPGLSQRFAVIEIVDPSREEVVFRSVVPPTGAPVVSNRLWRPVDFLMQVEAIGMVGEPVLVQGSGVEEVDQFLRGALSQIMNQQMLAPGYYRVSAGP